MKKSKKDQKIDVVDSMIGMAIEATTFMVGFTLYSADILLIKIFGTLLAVVYLAKLLHSFIKIERSIMNKKNCVII